MKPSADKQLVRCFSVSLCTALSVFPHCSFVSPQVLLLFQKEKEESPPAAQVKAENRENLKHCGHCQVLNGSNYTAPLPPFFISSQPPPHLSSLSPYFHCLHSVPPTSCSLSFSVLPSYWRVKGMLQSYWLHNRLLIPLSMKNKCTYITTGGLRKSKKAVSMKLEYRGVNMKKYCLKQLMYFRFHEDQLLIAGTIRLVPQKDIYSLEFFFFLSSFGVCYGIKVKRKRWTMLMLNLRDTGSISSIKQNLEDFYVLFFFFPLLFL